MWYSFLYLRIVKIHFPGSPIWFILVSKILEFRRWKLWDKNFVPFHSGNIHVRESKKPGFTFSIELKAKFVWSHGLLLPDFENGDKNMKTFLKHGQIQLLQRKFENFKKKTYQKTIAKRRRSYNFLVEFQIWNKLLSSESTKEINVKNNWTTVKSKFFLRKNLKQKPSKTHCYVVCQLKNLIHYLNVLLPYTHPVVYLKCVESGIQTIVKPNKLSSVMVVCRYGFHNGVGTHVKIWWKYYPQNFCGVGSFYKSNIFMLKSQTWWWIFTFTAYLRFSLKLDMALHYNCPSWTWASVASRVFGA